MELKNTVVPRSNQFILWNVVDNRLNLRRIQPKNTEKGLEGVSEEH